MSQNCPTKTICADTIILLMTLCFQVHARQREAVRMRRVWAGLLSGAHAHAPQSQSRSRWRQRGRHRQCARPDVNNIGECWQLAAMFSTSKRHDVRLWRRWCRLQWWFRCSPSESRDSKHRVTVYTVSLSWRISWPTNERHHARS